MRRAAHIDRNQPEIVAALAAAGCCVQSLAALGCGVPDLLVWSPFSQELHLIEIKNPDRLNGSKATSVTEAQRKFAKYWKGRICTVETISEALAAVCYDGVPWKDNEDD